MDFNPGYKYIEKFRVGYNGIWLNLKLFFSSICFKLKNENNRLVSLKGQSLKFRLSVKKI